MVRVAGTAGGETLKPTLDAIIARLEGWPGPGDVGDGERAAWLSVIGVKLVLDGVIDACTAAMTPADVPP